VLVSIGRITIILSDALLSISLRVTVFFLTSLCFQEYYDAVVGIYILLSRIR